jgi:hypothetical protein
MGEGFGADVANACYVDVGGVDEGVGEVHVEGMGVNFIDDGLDCFFGGFFAEEREDLLAFEAEWCIYSLVS